MSAPQFNKDFLNTKEGHAGEFRTNVSLVYFLHAVGTGPANNQKEVYSLFFVPTPFFLNPNFYKQSMQCFFFIGIIVRLYFL